MAGIWTDNLLVMSHLPYTVKHGFLRYVWTSCQSFKSVYNDYPSKIVTNQIEINYFSEATSKIFRKV